MVARLVGYRTRQHRTEDDQRARRTPAWLPALALGALVLAAYWNSLGGALVFDDHQSIPLNPTIRHLGSAWHTPSAGETAAGRPVFNLSLALNYAVHGLSLGGYHAVNLAIHFGAALLVAGVVRRTLRRPGWGGRFSKDADALAWLSAALWALHPLQTQAVTYLVQRAESLMGLFYLLALYGWIRMAEAQEAESAGHAMDQGATRARRWWAAVAVAACWLGMATKEVMASAPVLIAVYDRLMLAGSWRELGRKRGWALAGIFSSWVLLGALVIATGGRSGTVGFGSRVEWWPYVETQFHAVVHYLQLSVWPGGQVFDYGLLWLDPPAQRLGLAVPVLLLAAAALVGLWRKSMLGFLGLWFFAILAPTSLVAGNRQTLAEHRMYLALLPVVIVAVLAAQRWLGRTWRWVLAVVVLALAVTTARRNEIYRTEPGLWADVVAKVPTNYFAQSNYGGLLVGEGRLEEAVTAFEAALRVKPDYANARNNLGNALLQLGRTEQAVPHLERALALAPDDATVHYNYANALLLRGQAEEAMAHYDRAVELKPDYPAALYNGATALARLGRQAEAAVRFERCLALQPGFGEARFQFALTLLRLNRGAEAVTQLREAVKLQPGEGRARELLKQLGVEP
jgi:tetratricopeptide (TPR) repeat protein